MSDANECYPCNEAWVRLCRDDVKSSKQQFLQCERIRLLGFAVHSIVYQAKMSFD